MSTHFTPRHMSRVQLSMAKAAEALDVRERAAAQFVRRNSSLSLRRAHGHRTLLSAGRGAHAHWNAFVGRRRFKII